MLVVMSAVLSGLRSARAVRHLGSGNRNDGRPADGILRAEAGALQVRADGEARDLQRAVRRAFRAVGIGAGVSAELADRFG